MRQHDHARFTSAALASLMAVQSASGLLFPSLYRDEGWIRATWFGNDLVTLVLAVPLLVASMRAERRGSVRARLLVLGVTGYAVYNSAFYLLGAALNAFFPLYALTFVAALTALVLGVANSGNVAAGAALGARTRVRLIGAYMLLVAVSLSVVWLAMWAAHLFMGRDLPGGADAFRLVAALDLTLMVPALACGGVLLWRGTRSGTLIASIAGVQASLYLLVLSLNSAIAIGSGLAAFPGEIPLWLPLAVATSLATAALLALAGGERAGEGRLLRWRNPEQIP